MPADETPNTARGSAAANPRRGATRAHTTRGAPKRIFRRVHGSRRASSRPRRDAGAGTRVGNFGGHNPNRRLACFALATACAVVTVGVAAWAVMAQPLAPAAQALGRSSSLPANAGVQRRHNIIPRQPLPVPHAGVNVNGAPDTAAPSYTHTAVGGATAGTGTATATATAKSVPPRAGLPFPTLPAFVADAAVHAQRRARDTLVLFLRDAYGVSEAGVDAAAPGLPDRVAACKPLPAPDTLVYTRVPKCGSASVLELLQRSHSHSHNHDQRPQQARGLASTTLPAVQHANGARVGGGNVPASQVRRRLSGLPGVVSKPHRKKVGRQYRPHSYDRVKTPRSRDGGKPAANLDPTGGDGSRKPATAGLDPGAAYRHDTYPPARPPGNAQSHHHRHAPPDNGVQAASSGLTGDDFHFWRRRPDHVLRTMIARYFAPPSGGSHSHSHSRSHSRRRVVFTSHVFHADYAGLGYNGSTAAIQMLRHPVQRCASAYYHFARTQGKAVTHTTAPLPPRCFRDSPALSPSTPAARGTVVGHGGDASSPTPSPAAPRQPGLEPTSAGRAGGGGSSSSGHSIGHLRGARRLAGGKKSPASSSRAFRDAARGHSPSGGAGGHQSAVVPACAALFVHGRRKAGGGLHEDGGGGGRSGGREEASVVPVRTMLLEECVLSPTCMRGNTPILRLGAAGAAAAAHPARPGPNSSFTTASGGAAATPPAVAAADGDPMRGTPTPVFTPWENPVGPHAQQAAQVVLAAKRE